MSWEAMFLIGKIAKALMPIGRRATGSQKGNQREAGIFLPNRRKDICRLISLMSRRPSTEIPNSHRWPPEKFMRVDGLINRAEEPEASTIVQ